MPGFDEPLWLLLLPAPWLLARLLPAITAPISALHVPPRLAAQLAAAGEAGTAAHSRLLPLLWACLVLALADPRIPWRVAGPLATGRDIIVALDLSGSMGAADLTRDGRAVTRLAAVKAAVSDFVDARAGDRIGLVFFADEASLAAAPSFDTAALSQFVAEAELGLVGRSTAIGDAIGLASKHLQDSPARDRSIVLLSDGVNNAGTVEPEEAARLAAALGVRIHAIALAPGGVSGEGPSADSDPEALKRLAALTGGRFFTAVTTRELDAAYGTLSAEMARALPAPQALVRRSLAWLPLACAYGLCLLLVGRRARLA